MFRAVLLALLLTGPAYGLGSQSTFAQVNYRPIPTGPTEISVQLVADDGRHVDLFADINYGPQVFVIATADSNPFGVDWQAWSNAAIDPDYNRVIFTLGGVTKEQPFVRTYEHFKLEQLAVGLDSYLATYSNTWVSLNLIDYIGHIPADFNWDGLVDARDYVQWKNGSPWLYHATRSDGKASPEDYDLWRANFGKSDWDVAAVSGGLSAASIPEPSAILLIVLGWIIANAVNRHDIRGARWCRRPAI